MEARRRPRGLTRDTESTEAIRGAYLPSEAATLRKDLEKQLNPHGFRPPAATCATATPSAPPCSRPIS